MANYLKINKCATADGPGVRVSVYLAGCPLHCKGCHNTSSWDFSAGNDIVTALPDIITSCESEYISGLSILGGEPLAPANVSASYCLAGMFKSAHVGNYEKRVGKTIWLWTGYTWEELIERCNTDENLAELLSIIDVIVVGRFELDKRDITKDNLWRGSTNQRVLDVQESLKQGKQINLANIPNNENIV